jgi:pilus assembly protein Flp/PilA
MRPTSCRPSALSRLARDQRGATAVEYALIVSLIVIAMVAALRGVADTTINMWTNVSTTVHEVSQS